MKVKTILIEVNEATSLCSLIDELMALKVDEGNLIVSRRIMIPFSDKDTFDYQKTM